MPSSTPRRSGERVKTDRRDASYLASLYAASLMTTINIPDEEQEAIRSMLHCREDLRETLSRSKQQILTCLLTRGFQCTGKSHWTKMIHTWVRALPVTEMDQITLHIYLCELERLEQEVFRHEVDLAEVTNQGRCQEPVKVLIAFRGISLVSALTLIFELGDTRQFAHPRQLIAFLGLVPSKHNSVNRAKRDGTTKTGNVHVGNAMISAARKCARPPRCSWVLIEWQQAVSAEVVSITWKSQHRLDKCFQGVFQTKPRCGADTAVAHEPVGLLCIAPYLKNPSTLPLCVIESCLMGKRWTWQEAPRNSPALTCIWLMNAREKISATPQEPEIMRIVLQDKIHEYQTD
ncbi:MAG: IS110 family transposase [Rhodothermaceae bacterium]|nr:IS110 family transposase [Rhodothermaceae bacterium]